MKIILLLIFYTLFIFNSIFAATTKYYSILDGGGLGGNWSNNSYWSKTSGGANNIASPGASPAGATEIYIQTNMNLDADVTTWGILDLASGKSLNTLTKNLEIKGGGRLYVTGTLTVWNLIFDNGSTIDIKPGGKIVVLNDFTNKNNSDAVTVDGTISVTGTFYNGNGGDIQGAGSITAGTFTGGGTTFGHNPNSVIPAGSTVNNGPLPIELVSFTAANEKGKVVLKWSTSAEINNDYFSIERSSNGLEYEVIEKLKGQGNSNSLKNYSYNDSNPLHGISYYRLRQTDFDGKNTVSEIDSVDISRIQSLPLSFEIYPNPVSQNESTNIKISEYEPETEVLVVVRNLLGQELYSKVVMTDFSGNSITAIDLENNLPSGTYLIIGTSVNQTFNKYLIIK